MAAAATLLGRRTSGRRLLLSLIGRHSLPCGHRLTAVLWLSRPLPVFALLAAVVVRLCYNLQTIGCGLMVKKDREMIEDCVFGY